MYNSMPFFLCKNYTVDRVDKFDSNFYDYKRKLFLNTKNILEKLRTVE